MSSFVPRASGMSGVIIIVAPFCVAFQDSADDAFTRTSEVSPSASEWASEKVGEQNRLSAFSGLVMKNALVVIYGPTPWFVANAEVIADGQNRSPLFGDSTADSIRTPGWDIGSTQDQPGEARENMPPPVHH
jgi:hypothetical protein